MEGFEPVKLNLCDGEIDFEKGMIIERMKTGTSDEEKKIKAFGIDFDLHNEEAVKKCKEKGIKNIIVFIIKTIYDIIDNGIEDIKFKDENGEEKEFDEIYKDFVEYVEKETYDGVNGDKKEYVISYKPSEKDERLSYHFIWPLLILSKEDRVLIFKELVRRCNEEFGFDFLIKKERY